MSDVPQTSSDTAEQPCGTPTLGADDADAPSPISTGPAGTGFYMPRSYREPSRRHGRHRTRSRGASFRFDPQAISEEAGVQAGGEPSSGSGLSLQGAASAPEDVGGQGLAHFAAEESTDLPPVSSGSAPVAPVGARAARQWSDQPLTSLSSPLARRAHPRIGAAGSAGIAHVMRLVPLDLEEATSSSSAALPSLDARSIPLPEDVFTSSFISMCRNCAANCDCPSCITCRQHVAAAISSAAAAATMAITTIQHHACTAGTSATSPSPTGQPSRPHSSESPGGPTPQPPACSSADPVLGPSAFSPPTYSRPALAQSSPALPAPPHQPPRRRHTLPSYRFPHSHSHMRPGAVPATSQHSKPRSGQVGPGTPVAAAAAPGMAYPAGMVLYTGMMPPGYQPYLYPAYGPMLPAPVMWQAPSVAGAYGQEPLPLVALQPAAGPASARLMPMAAMPAAAMAGSGPAAPGRAAHEHSQAELPRSPAAGVAQPLLSVHADSPYVASPGGLAAAPAFRGAQQSPGVAAAGGHEGAAVEEFVGQLRSLRLPNSPARAAHGRQQQPYRSPFAAGPSFTPGPTGGVGTGYERQGSVVPPAAASPGLMHTSDMQAEEATSSGRSMQISGPRALRRPSQEVGGSSMEASSASSGQEQPGAKRWWHKLRDTT